MSVGDLLEDFAELDPGRGQALSEVMIEDLKLAAFERGYQAGWDDSAAAQQTSESRLSEDFARNIRDLSFTYNEAYCGFVAAMRPLIGQIVASVLPGLARATLGARVTALLEQEIADHGRQPVTVTAAPDSLASLAALLPQDPGFPLEVRPDDTLAEGQVQLRIGDLAEREIDLGGVLEGIRAAIACFFEDTALPPQKETA